MGPENVSRLSLPTRCARLDALEGGCLGPCMPLPACTTTADPVRSQTFATGHASTWAAK